MVRKTVKLPLAAEPSIEKVLREFLAEQKRRLSVSTFSKCEDTIDLLRSYLGDERPLVVFSKSKEMIGEIALFNREVFCRIL